MQKRIATLLAFSAILGACGGSSADEAASTDTEPELAAETTIEAPTPVAETDFDAIYRALDATRTEAYQEADPDKLATVSGNLQDISDFRTDVEEGITRTRSDDHNYTIDEVTVFHVANEDQIELRVVDSVVGETILLDADGNEADRFSRDSPVQTFIVELERTGVDEWQIVFDQNVPNEFPATSEEFVERNQFQVGDTPVLFKTADAGDSECYSLSLESIPLNPVCQDSDQVDNGLLTNIVLIGDNEFEAIVGITRNEADDFFVEVDGESVPFFGDNHSYAVKVAEFGTFQEQYAGSDFSSGTTEIGPLRDRLVQIQEGTFVEEETEPEEPEPAETPAQEPAPTPAPAPEAPAQEEPLPVDPATEPAPGPNEPGGPTIEVGPDGEIIIGIGG